MAAVGQEGGYDREFKGQQEMKLRLETNRPFVPVSVQGFGKATTVLCR